MIRYPVKLTRDSDGSLLVTAPDLPEVASFVADEADALVHAADAIATALQSRIGDRKDIPATSP
jgi:antitoxin HicB